MGRIIAIANQKGGVGKTTTAINLSACLAEAGQRVLTIDSDPQGNTTSGLGIDKNSIENTIYELILGEVSIEDTILETEFERNKILEFVKKICAAACQCAVGQSCCAVFFDYSLTAECVISVFESCCHHCIADDNCAVFSQCFECNS